MSWFIIYLFLKINSKIFFLNFKGLSDDKVVSSSKKEYGSAVYVFINLYKIFKVNVWWMIVAISWSFLLFGIFIIMMCVLFSLTSFGTLKCDCVIKTIETFNFLSLKDNSVTSGFSFLLLIIPEIISSKTIKTLRFFLDCILQYFYKHLEYHLSIQ